MEAPGIADQRLGTSHFIPLKTSRNQFLQVLRRQKLCSTRFFGLGTHSHPTVLCWRLTEEPYQLSRRPIPPPSELSRAPRCTKRPLRWSRLDRGGRRARRRSNRWVPSLKRSPDRGTGADALSRTAFPRRRRAQAPPARQTPTTWTRENDRTGEPSRFQRQRRPTEGCRCAHDTTTRQTEKRKTTEIATHRAKAGGPLVAYCDSFPGKRVLCGRSRSSSD